MAAFGESNYNAALYRDARPTYDARIFDRIDLFRGGAGAASDLAVDIGSGTGQVANNLATRGFKKIIAIEPSAVMRANALQHPNITYFDGNSNHLIAADGTADLVVAAQAAHWFDMDKFLAEVKRVLKPSGVLAIIGYAQLEFPECPAATKLVWDLAESPDQLLPHWPSGSINARRAYARWSDFGPFNGNVVQYLYPESDLVNKFGTVEDTDGESLRASLDKRARNVKVEYLEKPLLELDLSLNQLRSYLKTWSAYKLYTEANAGKPDVVDATVDQVTIELKKSTGEDVDANKPIRLQWQHTLILAKL